MFVARARKPWSTPDHFTFSQRFKNMVHTMLLVAILMENTDGHALALPDFFLDGSRLVGMVADGESTLYMPTEMWQLICSFVLRSSYRRLD